ncbi:FG-GAP repeat domain-containing protein [Rubrivirga sp. IMCC45206]|uniref:FG-GAP repeat domain-containing protein n=1 Tax=Rubrivirga sp. IMCC45206 TaxID=3391614 RepID=UPI0039903536
MPIARCVLLALAVAVTGCGESPGAVGPGTARMADTLAARVAAAHASPMPYFVLNTARADLLEAAAGQYRGDNLLRARFDLARERLNAGDTDAAIGHLVDLADATGGPDAIAASPLARAVHTLLATAHLRRGEQANCLANHHAGEVCVLPFRGAAVHADPDGAQRAADVLADLLAADPDDLGARWLFNVAHQALGTYPDGAGEHTLPGLGAPDAAPRWRNTAPQRGAALDGISGGVSAQDFDGDGDADLLVTSYGLADPIRYLENRGGQFVDATEAAGLTGLTGGLNTIHGDIDHDGDADVLVLRGGWFGAVGGWPNSLLLNDGTGRFEDVTYAAGLGDEHPTQTAAFADIDGDGDLDLFVGNESGGAYPDALGETATSTEHPSQLFLNEGTDADGVPRFRDVSVEAGVVLAAFVKGAAFGDVEGDGRPDLYVSVLGGPNTLYLNRTENGRVRFVEGAAEAGVAGPAFSFPVAWFDADGDGRDDLVVVSYDVTHFFETPADAAREALGLAPTAETTRLFLNAGDGTFRDASAQAGLAVPLFGMGLGVGDLDGDGRLDLYVGTGAPDLASLIPNRVFLNRSAPGAPAFEDATLTSGLGHLQKGHAIAFGDLDGDGDEDVYGVMGGAVEGDRARNVLFEGPDGGRWLTVTLVGRAHAAHGARLALRVRPPDGPARTLLRTVGTGASFGAGTLALEVGLGDGVVEGATVRWPGGAEEAVDGLAAGGRFRLVEGTGRAERVAGGT